MADDNTSKITLSLNPDLKWDFKATAAANQMTLAQAGTIAIKLFNQTYGKSNEHNNRAD